LAQNQLIETNLIDTRKGNSFTLNFDVFSNEGTSNERTSSETQFNTPILTNSYNVDNEGTGRLKPQLNLLALVKLFKRQSSNLRTSSLGYSIQLKIEFFDKNKVLKSSNIQTINLNAGTWQNALYQLPTIQDNTIFYVKFSIINPNTFVVYLDNWKIEEKGKVILQENHYYPYGKEIVSLGRKGNPNHEFTYNGKELSEEFNWNTYDYGARGLDADFPVWKQVDPLAEKMRRWSPYAYAFSNPVKFIDPDGMMPSDGGDDRYKRAQARLNKKIDQLQSKMDDFTSKVKAGGVSNDEIKSQTKGFGKQLDKIKSAYARTNHQKDQGKTGMPINQSLSIDGGLRKGTTSGQNTISIDPNNGNTASSSFVYVDGLVQDNGTPAVIPADGYILQTNLDVSISAEGNSNTTIFGSSNIPIGEGVPSNANILHQGSQQGGYSGSFQNQAPATIGTGAISTLTNPNNTAGYGVNITSSGGSVSGQVNMRLTVTYYAPLKIQGNVNR
jgi:RHS repeat-associated protein